MDFIFTQIPVKSNAGAPSQPGHYSISLTKKSSALGFEREKECILAAPH
jgi:hypothetical protein